MRQRKKLMLYHPNKGEMSLYCYAIAVTMPFTVISASSAKELHRSRPDIDITLLWRTTCIEIRNHFSRTLRKLPLTSSNYDLREALRIGAARKRGPRKVSA